MFSVSAGPQSRVNRHMATVEFPGYGAALSRPGTALQAAAWIGRDAHLKFDCDCPHHRYRPRFIATIGGYNAGRAETGFPKLTNPSLSGVACKHVLRVMAELQGSMFVRRQLAAMIEVDRKRLDGPRKVKPQIVLVSQQQVAAATTARPRTITTTEEVHRRALVKGIRTAVAKTGATPERSDVAKALRALSARDDISAQTLLAALQHALKQPRQAAP